MSRIAGHLFLGRTEAPDGDYVGLDDGTGRGPYSWHVVDTADHVTVCDADGAILWAGILLFDLDDHVSPGIGKDQWFGWAMRRLPAIVNTGGPGWLGQPTLPERRRIIRHDLHLAFGDPEAAERWLREPLPCRGLQRPIDLIETADGCTLVERLAMQIMRATRRPPDVAHES